MVADSSSRGCGAICYVLRTAADLRRMTNNRDERQTIEMWFGLSRRVDRANYVVAGFVLMAVKYVVEVALIWSFTGKFLTPLDFVNPLVSAREVMLQPAPAWVLWVLYVWTLPFLWVA